MNWRPSKLPELTLEDKIRDAADFWSVPPGHDFQADLEEFQRQFGLHPEVCEMLGTRQFLREDTLATIN